MSLRDFIAQAKKGMIRSNRYEVIIPVPGLSSNDVKLIALLCDSVSLPGLNIATTPASVYGETTEMPYNRTFEPLTLSFYCDNGMAIKGAFETWMASIINPQTRDIGYYNDYVRNIEIYVQDVEDKSPYMVKIFEAYPKTIQAIQMDATNKEIMKISVTFQYKYWLDKFNRTSTDTSTNQAQFGDPQSSVTGAGMPQSIVLANAQLPNEFGFNPGTQFSQQTANRVIQLSKG